MSDIIDDNYHFLLLLDRLGIRLGFGDQTVEEICTKHHINIHFFILMTSVFHYKGYIPKTEQIGECPPGELLQYLQKSHAYYLNYRFPELEKQLKEMMAAWDKTSARIVETFFREYKKEVQEHLAYEEEVVFPYIKKLMNKELISNFSIHEFEEKHDDIEAKVRDLKNILIKYIPEKNDALERNEILLQLFLLEEDLNKHLLIENKVLVPVVELMENEIIQQIGSSKL